MRREAWRRVREAGPEQLPAVSLFVITTSQRHSVDVTAGTQRNQRSPSALYTSLMSDGTIHTKCMWAVNYLLCFLFPSHTEGDVSLKNHEMSWFRCRVHQNVVPVTTNLTPACSGQSQTWQSKESILFYLSTTQHRSTSEQRSCSYLSPKGTVLNLRRCVVLPSK